jgi:hypothetical protein
LGGILISSELTLHKGFVPSWHLPQGYHIESAPSGSNLP